MQRINTKECDEISKARKLTRDASFLGTWHASHIQRDTRANTNKIEICVLLQYSQFFLSFNAESLQNHEYFSRIDSILSSHTFALFYLTSRHISDIHIEFRDAKFDAQRWILPLLCGIDDFTWNFPSIVSIEMKTIFRLNFEITFFSDAVVVSVY